jgi:dTDP-4-dehydrorhamnose reductase
VDHCRQDPGKTALVNVYNTVKLAEKLMAQGLFVIFPSTNLVYDGSMSNRPSAHPTCPKTEYGRQKATVESQLLKLRGSIGIIRFTKILTPKMPLIIGWINALRSGQTIHPFSDMVMAPVSLDFAVQVLVKVMELRLPGILQVSARQDVTYEETARYLARRLGVNQDLVKPVHSYRSGVTLEHIPRHTALDVGRLQSFLGMEPPDVWATINLVYGLS